MIWLLQREHYLPDCTLGLLEVCGKKYYTLERPWEPHPKGLAGAEYRSCVPEGQYRLIPCICSDGEKAFRLSNPQLDVYEDPCDIPRDRHGIARSAIFIQAASRAHELHGGIAPGLNRVRRAQYWSLDSTRDAMNQIRTMVTHKFDLTLIIAGSQSAAA